MKNNLFNIIRSLEEALHQSDIRQSTADLEQLLHPEFCEIGRSGTLYTKADTVKSLTAVAEQPTIWSDHYQLYPIDQHTVQLIYYTARLDKDGRKSRCTWRSSLWVKNEGTWQLRFHQGTAVDSPESATTD